MALFLRFHDANPIDFGHLPTWENYNKENLNSKAHAQQIKSKFARSLLMGSIRIGHAFSGAREKGRI